MDNCNGFENHHNSMEMETLKQLRRNLSDILRPEDTDTVLLKWLRARNFNLRRCENIFREDYTAKQLHKIDHLEAIWKVPEVIEKYEFANHIGIAKDGTPIHYIAMGRGDLRGFIMSLDAYDICKYCCFVIEKGLRRCRKQSEKLGKEIHQISYIIDMEGFTLRQFLFPGVVEMALDLLRLLQDHYPEIWRYVFIVNAPAYFYTIFNLLKPILRNTFLKDVRVVSRENTSRLLLRYIDADTLPAFLGGKRVDSQGNPMCSEFMKFGGIVTEEYFLRNRSPLLATDEGAGEVWISPRSSFNYPVVIRQAESKILVESRTEGGSICGSALYRKFDADPENPDLPSSNEYLDPRNEKCNVVLAAPCVHYQSHVCPVNNCCFAPWPGIYIFKFDNSYNWLTSRKLIYRFRVVPPAL